MGTGEATIGLPQLQGRRLVTDGGMETDLIFHHGIDLPHFAAFPLVEREQGRALLERYYDEYAAIARAAGVGLMLESPTWRANPDWGARLGYSEEGLAAVNRAAIAMLLQLRDRYAETISEVVISGLVGPRGDGYRASEGVDPDEASAYHRLQLEAFAHAGADIATALTLAEVGEAIGIVRAAREVGLPVAISFTVETDGKLPGGIPLGEAIAEVDRTERPEYFLVNCAHPTHIARGLADAGTWQERILGVRANASTKSHAELDEADELDEGDPRTLAADHSLLGDLLPNLVIVGGCCGTDARHVSSLWSVP
jgi:homocysteine S-methyltransferase